MLRESGIFEREEVRRWVKCAEMCALAENVQGEEVEPGLFVMRGRSSLLHWSMVIMVIIMLYWLTVSSSY